MFSDIRVDAVKIGVLPDTGAMRAVAAALFKYKPEIVVCDPVIAATAGGELMNSSALGAFINGIIPLCSLLTPNIPEAETLLSCHIENVTDMKAAALSLFAHGAGAVLIKGGHLTGDATDVLFDGKEFSIFTHGAARQEVDPRNRLYAVVGDSGVSGAGEAPPGSGEPCEGLPHRRDRTRTGYRKRTRSHGSFLPSVSGKDIT